MKIDYIDLANKKALDAFEKDYLPARDEWVSWANPKTNSQHEVSLQKASTLSSTDFESCFKLVELTSSEDYKKSKDGWKPKSKRKEMKLLDLKYLTVKNDSVIEGFVSFMPTYEDGYSVLYCYEIHLAPSLQGTGLGTYLMSLLDIVAERIPKVEKLMLTSYNTNQRALQFYKKLGYLTDEYSPLPRQLRDGTKIEAAYVILSKKVPHGEDLIKS